MCPLPLSAVATHKYVISFCLGLELVSSSTRRSLYLTYMIVFALITPLGMAIGIGISSIKDQGSGYDVTVAALQG